MLNFPEIENKILKFWEDNDIFKKLRAKNQGKDRWSFLDGPITANNPMGVHHAWGRTYKDVFQRYNAMQGFDQRYQNGFDCQGLWVEVEVEKELGFKTKKDIEKYGIDKFVEKCKERVKKYSAMQTQQSIRLGQWMDWDNSYYTMSDENNYTIWGFLKKCHEKGYLYKGRDSVPWCPRCGTALSQHEILTEEYKEITHEAIYLKLPILDGKFKGANFLVWTTTPWTVPANVALAINPDFEYGVFEVNGGELILLKSLAEKILGKNFIAKETYKGKDLGGLKYEGPFDNLPRVKNAKEENPKTFHTVVLDKDLVTAEEGTGIVHIAPGAGEEDFKIGQKEKLPVIDVIDESAVYLSGMDNFSGQNAKTNPEIIFDCLKTYKNGEFLFKTEKYTHRYPTCWRCKTELVWRVVDEWYISMEKLRKPLMEVAKKIKWIPGFGLDRELDWLKNMHDWLISKKRYWGLALPIYECKCGNFDVIGSKEELKKRAVSGWDEFSAKCGSASGGEGNSPHRPWVDSVKIKCSKCKEIISRIPDVGNPWLDAGIVPFSTMNYNNNRKYWKKWFPAELVCESFPGQFKNWFYSIIVMSTVLEGVSPVKTIFGFASVHDEKDEEMHKSKGNAIWFNDAVEKVGADPMRWMYTKQNPADNLRFGYPALEEVKRKLLTLYNVFTFLTTYVKKEEFPRKDKLKPENILDKWIVSKLNNLIDKVDKNFAEYNPATAVIAIEDFFINDLSIWYLRRSRKRFHPSASSGQADRDNVIKTLYFSLLTLMKLIAPIMPFFAEEIYRNLKTERMPESVHLNDWPKVNKKQIDKKLEEKMEKVRAIVNLALAERTMLGIKVRQPLKELRIKNKELKNEEDFLGLIKDEVNVREIVFSDKIGKEVELNTELTDELRQEGALREIIRQIQEMRKKQGLKPEDKISIYISGDKSLVEIINKNKEFILTETKSKNISYGVERGDNSYLEKEIIISGQKLLLIIKKIHPC
ncbi:isoleucine--tRNA ligase [Patescibacteria group bacterium]|nr:isoleucine--tRNA ligase [Patescibacteria group bacterium]